METSVNGLADAAANGAAAAFGMTPLSWLYMILVWGLIVGLNVFCFYRVFTTKR